MELNIRKKIEDGHYEDLLDLLIDESTRSLDKSFRIELIILFLENAKTKAELEELINLIKSIHFYKFDDFINNVKDLIDYKEYNDFHHFEKDSVASSNKRIIATLQSDGYTEKKYTPETAESSGFLIIDDFIGTGETVLGQAREYNEKFNNNEIIIICDVITKQGLERINYMSDEYNITLHKRKVMEGYTLVNNRFKEIEEHFINKMSSKMRRFYLASAYSDDFTSPNNNLNMLYKNNVLHKKLLFRNPSELRKERLKFLNKGKQIDFKTKETFTKE